MKNTFFLLIALCTFIFAQAQIKIGVVAGPTFSSQKWVSNAQPLAGSIKTGFNFHIGATSDIPLSTAFSFQPEVYFSNQSVVLTQDFPLLKNVNKFELGYVKIPALITYMKDFSKMFWYIGAGPYAAKLARNAQTFTQNSDKINAGSFRVGTTLDDQITPWDFGIKLKTGLELKKGLNLGVYYEHGLKDINPQLVQTYNRVYGVSASYLFSLSDYDKYNRYPDYYNY
jgi:Outer membrane protein beta-barrel domain